MKPAPPVEARVQLVFQGECLDGHDPQAVRRAVAAALKLDAPRTDRLFSGKRVVLRRNVDAPKAIRYVARFALMGARLHAEPMPAPALEAPQRRRRRIPRLRPLRPAQRIGITLGCVAGGLVLGVVLGPGLGALWPETPTAPADATVSRQEPVTTIAAMPIVMATGATDAQIPPEMGADALREYRQRYLVAPNPKAFALSARGAQGWHAGGASDDEARARAQVACTAALRPGDDDCRIVDVDGVWQE